MEDFDHIADRYDAGFSETVIGKKQRRLVWNYLMKVMNPEQEVLELNCGTGIDAEFLAKRCKSVLSTDISPEMVKYAQKNRANSNLAFCVLDANQMEPDLGKYDLIFSNFGGLNCLSPEQWTKLGKNINLTLKPGGQFIAVIMSRNCTWERLYFRYKGDKANRDRRRSSGPIMANAENVQVKTWYYSPQEIVNFMPMEFKRTMPVGLFIPPSYLDPYFKGKKAVLKTLSAMESLSVSSFRSSDKADHYLIHFGKAGG